MIVEDGSLDHEYLPIEGLQSLTDTWAKCMLVADNLVIKNKTVLPIYIHTYIHTYIYCLSKPYIHI